MDDNNQEKDIKDDKSIDNDKTKTRNNNIVSIIFIIVVIIATIFMFTVYIKGDNSDNNNDSNKADDSAISTIDPKEENNGAQPGNNDTSADRDENNNSDSGDSGEEKIPDNEEFSDASIPKKKKVDDPSPTVPKPELRSIAPGELESSVDDYNPKQAEVGTSANIALKGLFDISLNKDENYDEASKKILKTHGTKRAQELGFKKWYDSGEHNLAWDSEKALGSRIVTSPKLKDKEWWANDILRMRWEVSQMVISKNASYKLEPFTVDTYMKYENGGWYLDTYTFPDGSHPQLY